MAVDHQHSIGKRTRNWCRWMHSLCLRRCFTIAKEKTIRPATATKFCTCRKSLTAYRQSVRTTWVEAATTRRMNKARNLTSSSEISNTLVAFGTEEIWIGSGGD